jgi:hypothetical protein
MNALYDEIDRLRAENERLRAILLEITGAYEALLDAYGKPFGWGRITSGKAREFLAEPQS